MTRGSLARGRNPPLVDSKSTQMLFKSQHVEQCNLSLVAVQTNGRERGGGRKSKVLWVALAAVYFLNIRKKKKRIINDRRGQRFPRVVDQLNGSFSFSFFYDYDCGGDGGRGGGGYVFVYIHRERRQSVESTLTHRQWLQSRWKVSVGNHNKIGPGGACAAGNRALKIE